MAFSAQFLQNHVRINYKYRDSKISRMKNNLRAGAIIIIFLLVMSPMLILEKNASAIDIGGGEESSVRVRAYISVHNDGILSLNFKVLYGRSEFDGSDIYRPHAPVWQWPDFTYERIEENLTDISGIDTIRHLFNDTISDGKKLTYSGEFFAKTVLGIDSKFTVLKAEPRVIAEFKTIEVKVEIKPDDSSYTISPLKFLSSMNFGGFPPVTGVKVETGPDINIESSSIVLNHFLYPEGHRFSTDTLYFGYDAVSYDTSKDSIKVQKLPPFLSSTILYYLWLGAAILSMIMVGVAGKKAGVRVNKGLEMWIGIGILCFLAFIPFHIYLSYLLILVGLVYSVRKSRRILPRIKKEKQPAVEKTEKEQRKASEAVSPRELVSLSKKKPATSADTSFAPPGVSSSAETAGAHADYTGAYSIEKYQVKGPMENVVKTGMKMEYSNLKILYTVYIENSTSHPIGDISVKPLVGGNHFIPDAVEKKITSIDPGESSNITFELIPNGHLSNAVISSIITYFDSITNSYLTKEVPPVTTTITVPMLQPVEINAVDWSSRMAGLSRAEQTIESIKLSGKVLFEMVTDIIKQMNMYAQSPQISEAGGFNGSMRFYAEARPADPSSPPARFGIQVIVTGDQRTSSIKIVVYAPDQAMLIGFYYHIIFQVANRMSKTRTEEYIVLDRKTKSDNVKFPMNYEEMMYQVASQVRKQFRQFTSQIRSPEDFEEIFPLKIEQVFLIDSEGGRLIMHVSKVSEDHIDSDVVGSMLTAIQDFVGDSFASTAQKREKLEELQYGELTVLIEHTPYVYLAVVVSGEKTAEVRKEMQELLERIYTEYKDVLKDWKGDKNELEGIRPMIEEFIQRCETVKDKKGYGRARELLKKCGDLLIEADERGLDTTEVKKQYVEARTMFKNGDYAGVSNLSKQIIKELKVLLKSVPEGEEEEEEELISETEPPSPSKEEELIPERAPMPSPAGQPSAPIPPAAARPPAPVTPQSKPAPVPPVPPAPQPARAQPAPQSPVSPPLPETDDMEELPDEEPSAAGGGGFPDAAPAGLIIPTPPDGEKPMEFDFGEDEEAPAAPSSEKHFIKCPACGKEIEDFWPECPYCGAEIRK